jgi:hypothetical protein
MHDRLWEWVAETENETAGICGTRHDAIEALSMTLVHVSGIAHGYVAPLILVDGVWEQFYIRETPRYVADWDGISIHWARRAA